MGRPKRDGTPAKPRIEFTDELLDNAVAMIRRGTQLREVALRLNCSSCALSRALRRRRGLSVRELQHERRYDIRTYTPQRAREIERLLREGMTMAEAACVVGLGESTLFRWANRGVLDTSVRRVYRRMSDEDYRRMHARYMADPELTCVDIARIYGTSLAVTRKRWRALGLRTDAARGRRLAAQRGVAHRCTPPTLDELAEVWQLYRRGYINIRTAARRLHVGPVTLRERWQGMGYDVEAATHEHYDAWHSPGAFARIQRARRSNGDGETR